jgi:hypothetical protein
MGITRPFEIPKEMRAVAEQSVEQTKLAFNNCLAAQGGQRLPSYFNSDRDIPKTSGRRKDRSCRPCRLMQNSSQKTLTWQVMASC